MKNHNQHNDGKPETESSDCLSLIEASVVDAIDVKSLIGNGNTFTGHHGHRHSSNSSSTLRRVSLLNTLLFLGLALSQAELHAPSKVSTEAADSRSGVRDHSNLHDQAKTSNIQMTAELHHPEVERQPISISNILNDEEQDDYQHDTAPEKGTSRQSTDLLDEEVEEVRFRSGEFYTINENGEQTTTTGESSKKDVFIVATVDGSLAAVETSTGKVLWKQKGVASEGSFDQKFTPSSSSGTGESHQGNDRDILLQPLVATTSTSASAKRYASTADSSGKAVAIPTIDGNVFLTTTRSFGDGKGKTTDGSVLSNTDVVSLEQIVARAPYVDANGLFFVGSRQTTAAAVDGDTGEILYVASSDSIDDTGEDPKWDGRNVVWLGRVDYSVSVYSARSSTKEVQFAASEIMSVNDMVSGNGKAERTTRAQAQRTLSSTSERAPVFFVSPESQFFDSSSFAGKNEQQQLFSELVATPSGNLAYRNPATGRVEWVADQSFDTPIAYAIHATSGHSLAVDIIPDVTMPSQSMEYLTREIERQIDLTLNNQRYQDNGNAHAATGDETLHPPIVGTLSNGQLYSMPLGRRRTSSYSAKTREEKKHTASDIASVHHYHSIASSSSVVALNEKHNSAKKIPLTLSHFSQHHDERREGALSESCGPSLPTFPGCLFKGSSKMIAGTITQGKDEATVDADPTYQESRIWEPGAVNTYEDQNAHFNSMNHQGYYTDGFHQQQPRPRNYRKMLRILASWLPPTIALLFVISFEAGRRARQNGSLKQSKDGNSVESNELLKSVDQTGVSGDNGGCQVIQITDQVLGYGGHGTVVFKGTLEGRNVAVKRMLKTYLASADREISLLIESDGHPNVVRYFLKEVKDDFVFLALELCDLSLHTLIGTLVTLVNDSNHKWDSSCPSHAISHPMKRLLLQIASGVKHIHSLRIVHNDLKPANILLALSKEVKKTDLGTNCQSIYNNFENENYIAKISDMGLGKMLAGQSSFGGSNLADGSLRFQSSNGNSNANVGMGPGTVGWMAPEAMRIKSTVTTMSEASHSGDALPLDRPNARASRSVDIFSLGCIFYSTLVPGSHPFGEWYEREANIMHNRPSIDALESISAEAYDLVSAMIQYNPRNRPTAKQVCDHPFFWTLQRKLSFMCDLSDRLETDSCTVEGVTIPSASSFSLQPLAIERNAINVVGLSWDKSLYDGLTEQRYRTYDPSSVRDLLRLLRNKKNHFQDLDADIRKKIGSSTDGLMTYFESCFPRLFMHCYKVCCEILSKDDPLVEKYSLQVISRNDDSKSSNGHSSSRPKSANIEESRPLLQQVEEEPRVKPSEGDEEDGTDENAKENIEKSEAIIQKASLDTSENAMVESSEELLVTPDGEDDVNVNEHVKTSEDSCVAGVFTSESQEEVPCGAAGVTSESKEALPGDGIVLWEGSTASRSLNCRGWIRSDEEWTRRPNGNRKRNMNIMRCAQDPKFRTRLCNHWDTSLGTFCPMRKKSKCIFAHGPVELRVKEGKRNRWGKLVDKNGNNSNPKSSGGEDTYGAARSIETTRKEEGKWNTGKGTTGAKKKGSGKKKEKIQVSS